jgi:hypothetical protein
MSSVLFACLWLRKKIGASNRVVVDTALCYSFLHVANILFSNTVSLFQNLSHTVQSQRRKIKSTRNHSWTIFQVYGQKGEEEKKEEEEKANHPDRIGFLRFALTLIHLYE